MNVRWHSALLRQRLRSHPAVGAILLYHRVAEGPDPRLLNVSPARFAEQLEVLRAVGTPVPLAEVRRGPQRRPRLAVTFDDGYRDNLTTAEPLLAAAGVPATVFVATGAVDGSRSFAWDGRDEGEPEHPALSPDEVGELARSPVVEIGGHTVTHPVLAHLPAAEQEREVRECRARLAELTGRPPTTFAYPYGTPLHYSRASVRAVAAAGFELACANVECPVGARSPRLELPRLVIRDWPGDELERRLLRLLRA